MTPVEKFSITISLCWISRRTSSLARSSFRLRVMLRLPGLSSSQEALRWERSGLARDSILITSAPSAPRYLVQIGPAITQLKSTILTPASGLVAERAPPPQPPPPCAGEGERAAPSPLPPRTGERAGG